MAVTNVKKPAWKLVKTEGVQIFRTINVFATLVGPDQVATRTATAIIIQHVKMEWESVMNVRITPKV